MPIALICLALSIRMSGSSRKAVRNGRVFELSCSPARPAPRMYRAGPGQAGGVFLQSDRKTSGEIGLASRRARHSGRMR